MAWNKLSDKEPKIDLWGNENSDNKKRSKSKNNKKIIKKNFLLDIKNFFYKIKHFFIKKPESSENKTIHPFFIMILIVFLAWFISGFYTVKEAEKGVVTNFGKFSHLVGPGLHWRPIFINEVKIINIENIRELVISNIMLTTDVNLVQVDMNIRYKISNPVNYLFSDYDPDDSLHQATDSALHNVIRRFTMDQVLTKENTSIQLNTKKEIESIIRPYQIGITILDVNFQNIRPPKQVQSVFNDAIVARENCEKYINEAKLYSKKVEFQASNQAKKILENAKSYSLRIILEAQGDIARFSQILPEYKMSKKITLKHLYIEFIDKLLSQNKKVFIDKEVNSKLFFLLDKLFSDKKLVDKNCLNNINITKKNISCPLKNKYNDNFSTLSPDNILEQRRMHALRSNIQDSERE